MSGLYDHELRRRALALVAAALLAATSILAYNVVQPGSVFAKTSVDVSFTVATRAYDGTTDAVITACHVETDTTPDVVACTPVTGATATFASKDVADGISVSADADQFDLDDSAHYEVGTVVDTTADITKADVDMNDFVVLDRQYDSTDVAAIEDCTVNNVVDGEDVTCDLSGASATFEGTDVGSHGVNGIGFAMTGAGIGNYNLSSTTPSTHASILPRDVTVSFASPDRPYNAGTGAAITANSCLVANVVGTEDVTCDASGATASFANKNVGVNKTVTGSGFVLAGAAIVNYNLTNGNSAQTTATISQRDLNVSATADDKVYNGDAIAVVHLDSDKVSGDTVNLTKTSATFPDKNVGASRTVTVNGIAIGGTDAPNYHLVNTSTTATASITQRDLHVTATADSKVYNGNATAVAHLSDDRVPLDVFTDSYTTATFPVRNAANGRTVTVSGISISGTDAPNYHLVNTSTTATANITKAPLTITAITSEKAADNNTNAQSGVVPSISGTPSTRGPSSSRRTTRRRPEAARP